MNEARQWADPVPPLQVWQDDTDYDGEPNIPVQTQAEVVLQCDGLCKSYFRGTKVPVLQDLGLELRAGDFVSIVGSSGSGKSTLLQLLGLLDEPDEGTVHWQGERIDRRSRRFRDRFRNEVVGFVFQFYHLLPELTTLENVLIPSLIRQTPWGYFRNRTRLREEAQEILDRVGLGSRLQHRPRELSGGEMQRAAIARALVGRPRLLLADEPTGNLDDRTGAGIIDLIAQLREESGLTTILVTHDNEVAARAERRLRLAQGRLEDWRAR